MRAIRIMKELSAGSSLFKSILVRKSEFEEVSYIKNTANIITVSRIIAALAIFLTRPMSLFFCVLYIYCGISDIIDGYIARKKNCESHFGAVLDSIADIIFFLAIFVQVVPVLVIPKRLMWWIGMIIVIRCSTYIIGFIKYHAFSSLHTILNKLTGLMVFISPLLYMVISITTLGIILCVLATISSCEELLIIIRSEKLRRDIKSILDM